MAERIIDGFVVETSRQVLLHGNWGDLDCEWDWDTKYSYFAYYEDANRFFKKLKSSYGNDCPIIRMLHCRMTFRGSNMIESDVGDEIKEYITENGKTTVLKL